MAKVVTSKKMKIDDASHLTHHTSNGNGTSTSQNVATIAAAAAAAASQLNPFYIDKIFNFQNMFLFSNAAAAASTSNSDLNSASSHFQQFNRRLILKSSAR